MTWAVARVGWPARAISIFGVNQRISKASPRRTKKAVSDRLFSSAMACIVASGSQDSSGQTAAGLPPKRLVGERVDLVDGDLHIASVLS